MKSGGFNLRMSWLRGPLRHPLGIPSLKPWSGLSCLEPWKIRWNLIQISTMRQWAWNQKMKLHEVGELCCGFGNSKDDFFTANCSAHFFSGYLWRKKNPPDSKCGAGQCEYDQLRCITKIVGLPPKEQPRPPFFAFFASGEESVISCRSVVVSNTFFVNFCLPTLGRWTEFDKDIHFKWVWNVETTN